MSNTKKHLIISFKQSQFQKQLNLLIKMRRFLERD